MKIIAAILVFLVSFSIDGQERASVENEAVVSSQSDSSASSKTNKVFGEDELFVNPQQNYLGIKVSKDLSGYYRYSLINENGKCNSSGHVYLNDEENSISIKNLKSGSYSLHVSGNHLNSIQKIELKK